MTENSNFPPLITEHGVFTVGDQYSYGIGDCTPESQMNYVQTYPWTWTCPVKSAREQVQDEILIKMATAIEANDLKQAKKLVELAKALKEL
jgi:hypothetical protein